MNCSETARIVLSDQEIAKPLSSVCPLIRFAHPAGSPMAIYLPSLGCGQSFRIWPNDRFHRASPLSAGAEKINPLVLIKFKSQHIDRHDGSVF